MENDAKKKGRKPQTENQKAAGKELVEKMKPMVILQYQGKDTSVEDLVEAAKTDFKKGNKHTSITAMALYLKPEENTAYYVVNDNFTGKIDL